MHMKKKQNPTYHRYKNKTNNSNNKQQRCIGTVKIKDVNELGSFFRIWLLLFL